MNKMTPFVLAPLAAAMMLASGVSRADDQDETIRRLEQRIQELDQRLESMASSMEEQQSSTEASRVKIGGYGEMHYNHLNENGTDTRTLDMHRVVLFFGYEFSERARFVTEWEVEHVLVSASSSGAVEIEQAYVELDVTNNAQLRTGILLMPVGSVNETHEPPTFYGVERPVIETTIIPTTWYSAGVSFNQHFDNGVSYDLMVSEGLKTDDPTTSSDADPFDLKAGKQKGSLADAYDLALTGRVTWRGVSGLELSGYAQYQPDLDQSAETSYAESATLLGGHVIYQMGDVTAKALYARWDVAGDDAKAAGKDVQAGGYVELDWKAAEQWGAFVRHSAWSQQSGVDATQSDVGVNYYYLPEVVFKADYQLQNEDAGDADGFNLGMGYHF
ncbi:porin [Parathalassolituus penaei]|uniref:Porin n=1 Tax=Parathalassolituus penaei TaxID=2997323 RepID=A0A9X3EKG4_9GAMM|nr:porin [Parathalassolituus penaei]MCY0964303.1 porin [Parathalassolituus penaei]